MKPAFQKNAALLADMAQARQRNQARVWWLGQSGFLLHTAGVSILFDPYLSDSLTRKYADTDKPHVRLTEPVIDPAKLTGVDLITSSHLHTDHFDGETLLPLLEGNPHARLLLPRANLDSALQKLGPVASRLIPIDAGETVTLDGMKLHGIPAAHNTVERDEQGHCRFLGFVAQAGGLSVYHSGDTLLHDGLSAALRRFPIDLALLPINGNKPERRVAGNLHGVEAARLAAEISARLAIPHHFDMFAFNTEPPDEFEAECRRLGQPFHTLRNGEGLDLSTANAG